MGTYSGLRVRGRIKPEYREAIAFAIREYEKGTYENHWCRAALEFPELAALRSYLPFAVKERADRIPGWFSDMADWDYEDPDWQTSVVDGYLVMQTVIKNYDDEYEAFCMLMPEIFDVVDHCEYLPEWMDEGALYALENGEMVLKAKAVDIDHMDRWALGSFGSGDLSDIEDRWESPWMLEQKRKVGDKP